MKKKDRNTTVILAANKAYFTGFYVTLHSIIGSTKSAEDLRFIVFCDDPQYFECKTNVGNRLVRIDFVSVHEIFDQFGLNARSGWYFVWFAAMEMEISERAVYIDCDTLCLNPLEDLQNFNMKGHPVAACIDPNFPRWSCEGDLRLRLAEGEDFDYFNTGFVLIDVNKWRQMGLTEKLFASTGIVENFGFNDQPLVNIILRNDIGILEKKWNLFSTHLNNYLWEGPCIIHFVSSIKPWKVWKPLHAAHSNWHYLNSKINRTFYRWIFPIVLVLSNLCILFGRLLPSISKKSRAFRNFRNLREINRLFYGGKVNKQSSTG